MQCAYTRVYHVHLYFHNILRKVSYYKFIVICVRMHFVCELSRVFYGIYIILLLLLLFLLWIFHEFIWFCAFACVIWSHLLAENKCSVVLHRSQAVWAWNQYMRCSVCDVKHCLTCTVGLGAGKYVIEIRYAYYMCNSGNLFFISIIFPIEFDNSRRKYYIKTL